MNRKNLTIRWRLITVLIILVGVAAAIEARLYFVQIVHHENYSDRADRQYFGPQRDVFDRGSIFFTARDGAEIAAATLKVGYKIAINPSAIEHPEDVYNSLATDLELDEEDFLYRTSSDKKDDPYEELARRVESEVGQKISERSIPGVSVYKEKWRFYPGKELAAHTVGFVSYNEDELVGQYGLERQYEDLLRRDNENIFNNFFVEIFSNIKSIVSDDSNVGGSIYTTIEPVAQNFLESELESLQSEWNSKMVGGIIMDPNTGEIHGMGLYPDFDLNKFGQVESAEAYQNHLVESVYEMGSIVKPLTVAIGLDQEVINPSSTYNDQGSMTMDGFTFYNYDKKARGVVPVQEILNQSLNTGVAHIVQLTGNNKFGEYMQKFFKGTTGVDLPNEQSALIGNLDSGRDIEYATASFGQGIAMTPISITRALAALGNGGFLVQPHLAKKIEYQNGFSKTLKYPEPQRIFKKETSEEISRMLTTVVDDALRGGTVSLPNHTIAAKTGTAQIAHPSGGYYEDRYLHSFFGYFPSYEPKFIVFLYIIEPQGAEYSSQTLTAPFMNIAKFLINYYEIPPDREGEVVEEE